MNSLRSVPRPGRTSNLALLPAEKLFKVSCNPEEGFLGNWFPEYCLAIGAFQVFLGIARR